MLTPDKESRRLDAGNFQRQLMAWTGKLAGRSDDAPKLADQIKMHSDMIVIRRDRDLGWSGTIIDDHQIQLKVYYTVIRVDPDGGVVVERDFQKTHVL